MQLPEAFAALLERTTPEAARAARLAFAYVMALGDDISGETSDSAHTLRAHHPFCSFWPLPDHVKLFIFNEGELLFDDEARLRGRGNASYVKLRQPEEVDDVLRDLLLQAYEDIGVG